MGEPKVTKAALQAMVSDLAERRWRANMAHLTDLVLRLGARRARAMLEAVVADPASPPEQRVKAQRILENHPASADGGTK